MKSLIITILCVLCSSAFAQKVEKTPPITAKSWLVADADGKIIAGTNTNAVRSIASITKLMTAIAVIDSGANLHDLLPVKWNNQLVSRKDLIEQAIIRSDNNAAKMLCDTYPGGYHRCIIEMNRRAQELGMTNTLFVEPTGLQNSNVSTAVDLVKLVGAATQYPLIVSASNTPQIPVGSGARAWLSNNTNSAVGRGIEFIVSKTGFIRDAGGCIVMKLHTASGVRTVILLGSTHISTRINEALALANRY